MAKTTQTVSLVGFFSSEEKSFTARCGEVFKLGNEKMAEFMAGFKALTDEDRQELCDAFNAAGLPTTKPTPLSQAA